MNTFNIKLDGHDVEVKLEDISDTEFDEESYNYYLSDIKDKEIENTSESKIKLNQQKKNARKGYKQGRVKKILCEICGLLVVSLSSLQIHMRLHTREKPFTCSCCDSKFPTKGGLKRHQDTYHAVRDRKFTCNSCGDRFFRKNEIITHMRIHTDERPYLCPFCTKRFRQLSSLIRHKRTHTGEKSYSCPICQKKFADTNYVRIHQRVHSNEKKFTCHLCTKSFKSKNGLNVHLKLHKN